MQVLEGRTQRVTISVSPEIKERVLSLKRGNQTYDDVLQIMLDTVAVGEKRSEHGIVFIYDIQINGENIKLKNPVPLKVIIDENESLILSNAEYSILVVCSNLKEGVDEAKLQLSDDYEEYTDDSKSMTQDAKELGRKLKNLVWE